MTKPILDTLDQFCTKATFFAVGKMALEHPQTVKDVLSRGHTLGTHTYSHPYNLGRMKPEKSQDEIERGLAAVATAAGQPIAPFFRFTGLADSTALLAYLQTRRIATFSVDAVSNDSYIAGKDGLVAHTLKEIEAAKGGIVLFHDIKHTTAKALPEILAGLKARGYSIVHLKAKAAAVPLSPLMAELAPKVSTAAKETQKPAVELYGTTGPDAGETSGALEVTSIAPEPKDRSMAVPLAKKPKDAPPQSKTAGLRLKSLPNDPVSPVAPATRTAGWQSRVVVESGLEDGPRYPPVITHEDLRGAVDDDMPAWPPATGWATEVQPQVRRLVYPSNRNTGKR